MTIAELHAITTKAMEDGKGDAEIYFDTEAVCFDVHCVGISSAYVQEYPFSNPPEPIMMLHWDYNHEPYHRE